jgi:hypothetical protein
MKDKKTPFILFAVATLPLWLLLLVALIANLP